MLLRKVLFSPLILAVAASLIVGGFGLYMIGREAAHYRNRERELVLRRVSAVSGELEEALNARLNILYAMEGLVLSNPRIDDRAFRQIASSMSRNFPSIRDIELAPGAVIRYVYPEQDPDRVRGLDLLSLPDQTTGVRATIRDGKMRLIGPLELVQGGLGLVARYPIYLRGRHGEHRFWGFASIVFDYPKFIGEFPELTNSRSIEFAIRGEGGSGTANKSILGSPEVFEDHPVLTAVNFPGGQWQIAARPRDGWEKAPPGALFVWWVVILSVVFTGVIVFVLRSRWLGLQRIAELKAQTELLMERLEAESQQLQIIFDTAGVGITFVKDRRQLWANRHMADLFGYSQTEMIGAPTRMLYPSEVDYRAFGREAYKKLRRGESYRTEIRMRRRDGSLIWVSLAGQAVNPSATELDSIWVIEDISVRKRNDTELKLAATVFSHSHEGIMIVDANGQIMDVNQGFSQITGYAREEVIGRSPKMLGSARHNARFFRNMWKQLATDGVWAGEVWNRHRDGRDQAVILSIAAVSNSDGTIQNYVGILSDITPIKQHQEALEYKASYDALTGLPNRMLLQDRLQQAMVQATRREQSLLVAFIDLDGFKDINDRYGHAIGDHLLVDVTQRMKSVLREGDTLARRSGDEFVAVLMDVVDAVDDEHILQRLLSAISVPVQIEGIELSVSASIGFTVFPEDDADIEMLIAHADQAMYNAKKAGKNRYAKYS